MSDLEAAQKDYDKKNKRLRIGIIVLCIYTVLLLTYLAIQTFAIQTTIAENQRKNAAASEERFKRYTEDNAKQHEQTQQYVRCIAQVLLRPIEERTDNAFAKCSKTGNYKGAKVVPDNDVQPAPKQRVIGSTPPSSPASPQPEAPAPKPPTTGSPPDPEPDDRSALGRLPLVGGLLDNLGL